MTSLIELLRGKKTYIVAIIGALIGISRLFEGNADFGIAFVLFSATAATLRSALNNL